MNFIRHLKIDKKEDLSPLPAKRILIAILLLAAVLRIWGVWHGYPYSYYPDEAHFVKRALSFGSGDLNPHWFHKPAFYMYLLFFEYGLFYLLGKITGVWHSVNDFAVFYIKNPGPFYLIGRVTTTLFSLGSIVFSYLTAKVLLNRRAGLIAALLLTLSLGHVMVAKDIKADTPCMFFTIVSAYFLVCYMKEKKVKNIILSALFAGIGTATKHYSELMLVLIFIATVINFGKLHIKIFAKGIGIFALCVVFFYLSYFICSPYNFVDPIGRKSTFQRYNLLNWKAGILVKQTKDRSTDKQFTSQRVKRQPAKKQAFTKKGVLNYILALRKGLGIVILLTLIIGLFLIVFNLSRMYIVFFIFPFLYSVLAEFLHPGYADIRHQVVIYPFIIVGSALFFVKIIELTNTYSKFSYSILLILIIPLYQIINYNIYISKEDTRNIAKAWIENNFPADTKILIEDGELKLSPGKKYFQNLVQRSKSFGKSQFTAHSEKYYKLQIMGLPEITYDITYIRYLWWRKKEKSSGVYFALKPFDVDMGNPLKPVGVMPYEYYKKNGFQYVVTTSDKYLNFREGTERARNFPSFYKFYEDLFTKGTLVKEFDPAPARRPGPIIKILRID